MRELKVVGLDVDGKRIICESDDPGEKFILRADDRLRAAVRGDKSGASQTQFDVEVPSVLRPKEIQARIRAGASVEQVAERPGSTSPGSSGSPTRCCWSAPAPPSWQPRHIPSSPTGPRC